MTVLEEMSFKARPIQKTFQPFEKWKGSLLKDYTVTFKILTVADHIEIGRALANEPPAAMLDIQRIQVLARAIVLINNQEIASSEELKIYKEAHKLNDSFSKYDFILIYLKKFPAVVRDTLYFMYEKLQDEYTSQLLGEPLPDELKLAQTSPTSTEELPDHLPNKPESKDDEKVDSKRN